MHLPVTATAVEAYLQCPRKAFLLLRGEQGIPHDYQRVVEEQLTANRDAHLTRLAAERGGVGACGPGNLAGGQEVLFDAMLRADGLEARCDALTRVKTPSGLGAFSYEPIKVIGTERAGRVDIMGLAFLGHVLNLVQDRPPAKGTIVGTGGRACRVNLAARYKQVRSAIAALKAWIEGPGPAEPPVVLNKHCPGCPFRDACRGRAEGEDNLSLLDRMTPKLMRKYQTKGVFTVQQLSYLFKPRRGRKGKRPVHHNLELQALAIRTGKVYVERLPDLPRRPVELFVDMEGIPDRDSHYLIGLLVCERDEARHQFWWAASDGEEGATWSAFVERAEAFPDAPIYHYGRYERKAFATLARRHGKGQGLGSRLVNIAASVYGKVYFPVQSNGLKMLGKFLGATWTSPDASGLQSLAWRRRWETTREDDPKAALIQYNREDCEALRLLVKELRRIAEKAVSEADIDFANHPKQAATEAGREVHRQFERILRNAHEDGQRRSVRIRARDVDAEAAPMKKGARKGHQIFRRIIPSKAGKIIRVPPKRTCPKHGKLLPMEEEAAKTVIDLAFTRNGCRKTITKYVGKRSYCLKCGRRYNPPSLEKRYRQLFGHGFQAWAVYQRVVLRLPYRIITQVMEHLFGVGLSVATIVNFFQHLADYYAPAEEAILAAIRTSDFVHVDETRINIQGVDHYVWVFTDGRHVAFRMTETREADIVREVLSGYEGVLVSDFYPGYDSLPCRQQKCLVHLIRDINDDLWKAPFDRELEGFGQEVRTLLVPILEAVDRYGLKAWHLRKFGKDVERFYAKNIADKEYSSELVAKYQKRFQRYRESLFTFLGQDGVPWNNNMAERAIRQLAVQRKISGSFFKRVAVQYLLLLAISQTCRFQEKSFLKFLLSKERDVDQFHRSRRVKYSAPVGRRDQQRPATPGEERSQPHETVVMDKSLAGRVVTRARARAGNPLDVGAPMPGLVVRVLAVAGEEVTAGQKLFTLEAMKMETTLVAEKAARVAEVLVQPGTQVEAGDLLLRFEG